MKNLIRVLYTLLLLMPLSAFAQDAEMADVMRSEGKIYVVLGVILIVLFGFILYLFLQDKKLDRLEKTIRDRNKTK